MNSMTRRHFLENSMLAAAALAAAGAPQVMFAEDKPTGAASNTVRVAIIGCRVRGRQHVVELAKVPDVEIVYVCDPDTSLSAELAAAVEKQQGKAPQAVQDMRRIFDDKNVDAVFIATPNHWHALAAIWAMQSGKDAYCEKPVSHNISEGRRIVQVSRKTGKMCQGGTQNRSNPALAEAIAYMNAGKLGEVKLARSIYYGRREPIGPKGTYEVPKNVDYDLFMGPAPLAPLTRKNFHYDWHWQWPTGNGELGNNNIHGLDICRWGLGITGLGRGCISYGGRFAFNDAGETPNTQICHFDFGDKSIISETRDLKSAPYLPGWGGGWLFEGTEGFIAGTSLFDPKGKMISTFSGKDKAVSHFANFIDVVRSRKREDLKAEILEGHQSTALCHMGNISWRLGKEATLAEIGEQIAQVKVHGDPKEVLDRTVQHLKDNSVDVEQTKFTLGVVLHPEAEKESFADNPAANAFLTRDYRKPFVVPTEAEVA